MSDKLVDEITAILQREGFKNVTKISSSVSTTLASEKNGQRVVFHLATSLDVPSAQAVPLPNPTSGRDVRVKASFPSFSTLAGPAPPATGSAVVPRIKLGAGGGSPPSA